MGVSVRDLPGDVSGDCLACACEDVEGGIYAGFASSREHF